LSAILQAFLRYDGAGRRAGLWDQTSTPTRFLTEHGRTRCSSRTMMLVFHNRRDAPSVTEQPTVVPAAWRIVRTQDGAAHLVAMVEGGSLRLTSALIRVDSASRTVTTASGRLYELGAVPAQDPGIISMLIARALLDFAGGVEDVTLELWGCTPAAH
jgi:hypothetical protein